jgi:hypothetical protein
MTPIKSELVPVTLGDMSQYTIQMLPGSELLLAEHSREMPQKNELCGAFWITLALRALASVEVEQDHVGLAAGSILSTVQTKESLPPNDAGRADYVLELPRIDDSNITGTSPEGLVVATNELADSKLVAIPLRGEWTAEILENLLQSLVDHDQPTLLIANSATRFLWGGKSDPGSIFGFLSGQNVQGPVPDWNVGHYIGILGWMQGSKNKLAICADTYRSIGWQGMHFQPLARIADSLRRDDSEFSGGAFVVVSPSCEELVRNLATNLGLSCDLWDNGTPYVKTRK